MKDFRGVQRGQCTKCAQCTEYRPPPLGLGFKCVACKCPPGAHVNTSTVADTSSKRAAGVPDGVVTSVSGKCAVPGCGMPVDFDMNTGTEYAFCPQHCCSVGSASLPFQSATMHVQDIEMDDDGFGGNDCSVGSPYLKAINNHDNF